MKWPWVSRKVVDAYKLTLQRAYDDLRYERGQTAMVSANYDALLEKYHALKLSGATAPETPKGSFTLADLEKAYPKPADRDELRELIGEVCGTDYAKRKIMLRQLVTDRAAQVGEDVIRAAILQGVSADGVPT